MARARAVGEILWEPLPARRLRTNPRVVKRKMSKFPLKRASHRTCPQPTKPASEAILIIK